ncbi:protein INCREASED PETAL GROWTH ANISOTROPY 1-like [Miscanthus floridulus]|uniref:protein INCREASED PETAL GROWTH ANISOTROPY 1-like n=1 Tax=Miscanthus floridulus TaxID=154761 RepID=UPI003457C570
MVAGRVKAAMGFQRSPKSPAPEAAPSPSRTPNRAPPTSGSTSTTAGSAPPSKASALARSFGAYFPCSSAQVRPAAARAPPQVAELLRAIEQLQEQESRLRVELLEQKILKETVAIVPFLEAELAAKRTELQRCRDTADRLEAENARLCAELDAAALEVTSRKQRIVELEKEMAELMRKQQEAAAAADADDCSSSASAPNEHLESSSAAPNRASLAQLGAERPYIPPPPAPFKPKSYFSASSHPSPASSSPPSTSTSSSSPAHSRSSSDTAAAPRRRVVVELSKLPPIPPPPPPCPPPPPPPPPPSRSKRFSPSSSARADGSAAAAAAAAPPPPPPPPPARRPPFGAAPPPGGASSSGQCDVRRVPEVVEFYHSLMRRESKRDGGVAGEPANGGGVATTRDMIGEIENRSAHLLAIKSDVERQGDFIRFLIKEVEGAAFVDIDDVVSFVKWLDDELSRLVDERAVLKHFEWPEHKADALREAAFGYCDLRKLEAEAASFRDDARQPCAAALKKMQAVFEKLEHGVYNLARVRDAATSRYTRFQIPWEWMKQDTGIVSQIKLQSVKLAMKYLKRVSAELEVIKGGPEEAELMLQGVRFAFRVHQFAGGFDVDTMRAFQELKEKASMCWIQRQKQHRHLR